MKTTATVFLDREQMECLLSSTQAYRHFALTRLAPTPERNTQLRLIQQFQGKLLAWQAQQRTTPFALVACSEEQARLQTVIKSLLEWYGTQPAATARTRAVTDLGNLYLQVKHRVSCGTTANKTTGEKPSPGSAIEV